MQFDKITVSKEQKVFYFSKQPIKNGGDKNELGIYYFKLASDNSFIYIG